MAQSSKTATAEPEAARARVISQTHKSESSQSIRPPTTPILHLQRAIGNQAVQRMITSDMRQSTLTIDQPVQPDRVRQSLSHSPIALQRATINPEIARRFSSSRVRAIESAAARVPDVVRSATYVLERFLRREETARQRAAVTMAFEVFRSQPGWEARINLIIESYNAARDIIGSPLCLISFDPVDKYAEFLPDEDRTPGFDWEIEVGNRFFMRRPPSWWPGRYEFDLGLFQVLALLHEAIHYIHGTGHLQDPSQNPFRYMQLMLEIRHGANIATRFRDWHTEFSRRERRMGELIQEMERLLRELEQQQQQPQP